MLSQMGGASLQRNTTDKPNRFVCLISDNGKVVLTFITGPAQDLMG
jgi:hypothetical protein